MSEMCEIEINPKVEKIPVTEEPTTETTPATVENPVQQQLPFQKEEQWNKIYRDYLIRIVNNKINDIEVFFEAFEKFLQVLKMKQNIQVLRVFFSGLNEDEKNYFVEEFLPKLATRALELETLFVGTPVKMLKQHQVNPAVFTKRQISCVLSNMFFGTIDYQKHRSLIQWYDGPYRIETKIEKIKCLYNYFKRILVATESELKLNVIIQRLQFQNEPSNQSLTLKSTIKIYTDKIIEDFVQPSHIHIDFANQCIGGGVLDTGRVQEEIMFVTCPELLISCQICECIEDKESILIIGAERYSQHSGYSQSFIFKDNFVDPRGIDTERNCKQTAVVAIDALFFHEHILELQYQPKMIFRELIKALTGFQITPHTPTDCQIVTGNWGCGTFHGDAQLKFLIQWIACSMNNRDMIYCTFGNENLANVSKIVQILKGQLVNHVILVIRDYQSVQKTQTVFEYIMKEFSSSPSSAKQAQQTAK